MLSADLTVVDNHASLTLPGSEGSKVYSQIASAVPTEVKRRIAATALTNPQIIRVGHVVSGTGFKMRVRTVIRHDYSDVDNDPALTGGIVPSSSFYTVLDRPVSSGGAITTAILKNQIGATLDVMLTSGALDKILNMES